LHLDSGAADFQSLQTKRTDDVSMYMLVISVAGNAFWLLHASMTQNLPLMSAHRLSV